MFSSEWEPINTNDYCRVIRCGSKCLLYTLTLNQRPDVSRCLFFVQRGTTVLKGLNEASCVKSALAFNNYSEWKGSLSKCHRGKTKEAFESYLAALTSTDTIVISRGLVLADEAGLVDSGRGRWRWRAGDELLWTGALCFNGCQECK